MAHVPLPWLRRALPLLIGSMLGVARPASASPPTPTLAPPPTITAQTPVSAPPTRDEGFAGGFSLERGAWLATPHIEFGIGLLAVLRYGATFDRDGVDTLGFTLPFVRPNLHASVFDGKLRFLIQPEFGGGAPPRLLDAQLVYQPIAAFGLDLGQYRPHVSRAWNTPIPTLALPGRGTVDDAFRSDRALGATVFGRPFDGKLEYDVGVFNAGGFNLAQPVRLEPLVTWRLAVNPLGAVPFTQTPAFARIDRVVFGFGAHGWTDRFLPAQTDPAAKPVERQRVTAGGDFVLMTPRVHVLVEGFARWQVNETGLVDAGWGSQAQLGVMVLKDTLELQTRAGVLDTGVGATTTGIWEGGLSWYVFGNHVKAQLHYVCTQSFADPVGCASHRAELQTQLWF